jgi:predicted nucleic acid-binding protein
VILYVDASALVKLYVEEPGSQVVAARVEEAEAVATVRVTYAEARAALVRHRREGGLTGAALRQAVRQLDGEWGTYNVVEVSEPVVRRAGTLAERHGLRGYDAVQLAAALDVRDAGADLEFACFDTNLVRAAARERLPLATR